MHYRTASGLIRMHWISNETEKLRAACYVNGQWIGAPTIPVTNPATGETVSSVPKFGVAEAKAALPAWSSLTVLERSAILRRCFDERRS
jgi:succinate-semialdehyde dehydrogenase / glutarate-semialdehyde dehydrogenase